MMKWHRRELRYDLGPNLTPLVDVVLVVLIFLMLSGAMATPRVLTAKTASVSGHGNAGFPPQEMLELRVQEDASAGSWIVSGPGFQVADSRSQLVDTLSAKQRAFAAAGLNPARVRVVIRPSASVPYQHVLNVYEAVRQAQFANVAFGATH